MLATILTMSASTLARDWPYSDRSSVSPLTSASKLAPASSKILATIPTKHQLCRASAPARRRVSSGLAQWKSRTACRRRRRG